MKVLRSVFNKKLLPIMLILGMAIIGTLTYFTFNKGDSKDGVNGVSASGNSPYWLLLKRKSSVEMLYKGTPGDVTSSKLIKIFSVKAGMPGERPTPLPQLLGREYWILTKKEVTENPETAPYFLTLNVPTSDAPPYGPSPYLECDGQCNWVTPGPFGLHGIGGDPKRLSKENPGSSGCVRHRDEDITYLYNLLEPEKGEIRYYIEDV